MKTARSDHTAPRRAGLIRFVANLRLPTTVDFLQPPERVFAAQVPTTPDVLTEVVDGFLAEHYSTGGQTGDTYCSSLRVYLEWCQQESVDPLLITRPQCSTFANWMAENPSELTREPRSPSRRGQILAACTALLDYAMDANARPVWSGNPMGKVKRPVVDKQPKLGPRLTVSHVNQLVLGARADHLLGGVLGKLLVAAMARMGLRPGDVCRLGLDGASNDQHGGYELLVPVKGGKFVSRWLPPDMASDFNTYLRRVRVAPGELEQPDPDGPNPLFVHPRRKVRLNTDDLLRLVRRAAAHAGLAFAGELCSRDFRPFFNTTARALGVDLEDRRRGLGHATTATTERYDRTEWAREHDPAIRVSAAFGDYPAEELIGGLADQLYTPPGVQRGCDCTPVWPRLLVDLSPVGVDQIGLCVITEEPEPGAHQLSPYCARCRVAYPGWFRVDRVLDDPAQEWIRMAREGMRDAALYPEATQRRDERRRRDEP